MGTLFDGLTVGGVPVWGFLAVGMVFGAAIIEASRRQGNVIKELKSDLRDTGKDVSDLKTQMAVQEERHRLERAQDSSLISQLQSEIVALRLYIATLRGILADRGISSPEPPTGVTLTASSFDTNVPDLRDL